jgi:streptogramin lyase
LNQNEAGVVVTQGNLTCTETDVSGMKALTWRARLLGALVVVSATVAGALPANAAAGDTRCPSEACQLVVHGLGEPLVAVPDGRGAVYLPYQTGELRKADLATGAVTTVASGLGNLRSVVIDGASAYVTSFDGTLQKIDVATGTHRTLASGLSPLFGVTRSSDSTFVTDVRGQLLQVTDTGSAPRVVSSVIGFSAGVALDGAGNAYTADMMTARVQRTNLISGTTVTVSSEGYEPTSISVGADGGVYFTVGGEFRRLDPATGTVRRVTDIVGINGSALTLDASGTAYATDFTSSGSVWRITGLTPVAPPA